VQTGRGETLVDIGRLCAVSEFQVDDAETENKERNSY